MKKKDYLIQQINFTKPAAHNFSSGKYYKIFLIAKGSCLFELNESKISCNTETAIFLKPGEKTTLHFLHKRYPLEILSIQVLPSYLKELSDESCNLEESFRLIPLSKSVVHLDTHDTTLIKNLTKTILTLVQKPAVFGQALYQKNMLSILLILFLRSCTASNQAILSQSRKTLVLDDLFRYIREHLTEDLSLETLEEQFYVSRYHLCREFKKQTGQTIHAYIVKSRLDLCKKYIEAGKPIKEVYTLGGFRGYNHFFRAFKQEYGITPKEYYKQKSE